MASRKNILEPFEKKKDFMNDRIATGIEANRKGFAFLELFDEQGGKIKDAEIRIRQKTHDFKYGANLFMLDEFQTEEKNEKYRQYFAETFNLATLPFYWDALEPEQGKPRYAKDSPKIYRRPAPDLCLEFCEANEIEPKAHCLNYAVFMPQWAKGTVEWEKKSLEKRFRELSERYAERIPMWEVTNETAPRTDDRGAFYKQKDYVEWSFALAEHYFPANKLVINEASYVWNTPWFFQSDRTPYYMQIERAMMKGARIDSIGMQYHMFYRRENEAKETAAYYDPEQLFDVMDTYAQLGKPLQVTEVTIPAYSNLPEDEEIQAQIIRNLYRIWFSHPAMEAVIYWNLPDGYAHGAVPGDMTVGENYYHAGLIRFDLTPKPAARAIRDLFEKEWRTNLDLHTESGTLSFKGFYGEYDLEISIGGRKIRRSIHLMKNGCNHFEIKI